MITEETIKKIEEAFSLVKRENGLSSWRLDKEGVGAIRPDESSADRARIHLLYNDDYHRVSISINLLSVLQREGSLTVEGLTKEIERELQELRLIACHG